MTSYCPVPGVGPETPADHDYEGGFAAALMLKDLKLAMDAAQKRSAPTRRWAARPRSCTSASSTAAAATKDFSGIIKMIDDSWKPPTNRSDYAHCLVRGRCPASCSPPAGARNQPGQQRAGTRGRRHAPPPAQPCADLARQEGCRSRSCTSGTKAWRAIGKANKALHRELDIELARPRARSAPRRRRSPTCRGKIPAGSRRAPDPRSARPAPSRKSGRTSRISPPSSMNFQVAAGRSTRPPAAGDMRRSRRATPTSEGRARRATTSTARRCTTERARRSSSRVWDLPIRLFHWLLPR